MQPGTVPVLEEAELDENVLATALSKAMQPAPAGAICPESAADESTMTDLSSDLELPCRDDPELFFAESPNDVEFAKSLCMGCAVRLACLAGALERREPWGVWGGEVFQRGEVVPYKRPRGRPRKTTVAA